MEEALLRSLEYEMEEKSALLSQERTIQGSFLIWILVSTSTCAWAWEESKPIDVLSQMNVLCFERSKVHDTKWKEEKESLSARKRSEHYIFLSVKGKIVWKYNIYRSGLKLVRVYLMYYVYQCLNPEGSKSQ